MLTEVKRSRNSPHLIRSGFINYLKNEFGCGAPWIHPNSGEEFDSALIRAKIKDLKHMMPRSYTALWLMWTTNASRSFIADQLHMSAPTIKRKWDQAINIVLLMLAYPELTPPAYRLYADFEEEY